VCNRDLQPGTPHFWLAMVAKKVCSAPSKFLVDCDILGQYLQEIYDRAAGKQRASPD
jgi:hypothetical protein